MPKYLKTPLISALFLSFLLSSAASAATTGSQKISEKLFGINRSGAEFGADSLPGTEGVDFTYPVDPLVFQSFAEKGLTVMRVPFLWERTQPEKNGPLSPAAVTSLGKILDAAQTANMKIILDLHNYGRYYGKGLTAEDASLLADFWVKLLTALGNKPALFAVELMNEPHDLPGGTDDWKIISQKTIDAIRLRNTTVTILAPGYGWQSARFWKDNNNNYILNDPAGKIIYAAHQYFDEDFSGTYRKPTSGEATRGTEMLLPFISWLSEHNVKGIITEYGAPHNDTAALAMMENMLYTVDNNNNLLGAIYWSTGPWWGDYRLSLEPNKNGADREQLPIISNFPSRTNPPKMPAGIGAGNFVKFKNNPAIFQVESSGLRPFATWDGYIKAANKAAGKKLFIRNDSATQYTVRWRPVESLK